MEVLNAQPVPSHMRSVPGSINIPVAKFPTGHKSPAPSDIDITTAVKHMVDNVNKALHEHSYTALADSFTEDGYWRDHLALSWEFRTLHGPPKILGYLQNCSSSKDGFRLQKIMRDDSNTARAPNLVPIDAAGTVTGIQFYFTCQTVLGTGRGIARLVEQNGAWKIFTFYTRLEDLKGYEEPVGPLRSKGVEHGGKPGRKNWAERRTAASNFEDGDSPAVIIIGTCARPKCRA